MKEEFNTLHMEASKVYQEASKAMPHLTDMALLDLVLKNQEIQLQQR